MMFLLAIAGCALYAACHLGIGYWLVNNSPINRDQFAMEFFNKEDPKFNDGVDDDFDKIEAKNTKEYYEF